MKNENYKFYRGVTLAIAKGNVVVEMCTYQSIQDWPRMIASPEVIPLIGVLAVNINSMNTVMIYYDGGNFYTCPWLVHHTLTKIVLNEETEKEFKEIVNLNAIFH